VVVHGQATQTTNGNELLVTTQNGAGTKHSATDRQSSSIPRGSSTYFLRPRRFQHGHQPGSDEHAVAVLFGHLGSDGRVVLVNHTGVTAALMQPWIPRR